MTKRLDDVRANPRADWTIADVAAVCRSHGLGCSAARGGGSHYKVIHPSQASILTIPCKRPIMGRDIPHPSRTLASA